MMLDPTLHRFLVLPIPLSHTVPLSEVSGLKDLGSLPAIDRIQFE